MNPFLLSQMWANMLLSVASLILLMKLRFLYQEIQRRLRRHRNYMLVSQTLENRLALAHITLCRSVYREELLSVNANIQTMVKIPPALQVCPGPPRGAEWQ